MVRVHFQVKPRSNSNVSFPRASALLIYLSRRNENGSTIIPRRWKIVSTNDRCRKKRARVMQRPWRLKHSNRTYRHVTTVAYHHGYESRYANDKFEFEEQRVNESILIILFEILNKNIHSNKYLHLTNITFLNIT